MSRNDEEPLRTPGCGSLGGDRVTHPAFGQISASRVTDGGGAFLYGSDFSHHHYVVVRINESVLNRSLSRDWATEGNCLIEVALSEAQWATFVSTMNMGGGAQCTLQRAAGRGPLPGIASAPARKSEFKREMRETLKEAEAHLNALEAMIKASKATGAQKNAMWSELVQARNNLAANVTFVGKQFEEHIETITGHAKAEINAHIQHVLQRAGVAALNARDVPFELPEDTLGDAPTDKR